MKTKERSYQVLAPYVYTSRNGESEKAEAMFERFLIDGFSYDEISNHPDYPVYASAELLHELLPQMIDEMIKRKDTDNFLIYHIISALEPEGSQEIFGSQDKDILTRSQKLIKLADKNFAEKACQFLKAIEEEPPNGDEQVQRLLTFWKNKLKEFK